MSNCGNTGCDECGCLSTHNTDCLYYKGIALTCINVANGDNLTDTFKNINDTICSLTPSGHNYVVESCDSNIEISTDVTEDTTTYTVCLSADIINNIDALEATVSGLSTCISDTVADITSSSLTVTESSSDSCGRVINLEYTPSSNETQDGIIENDTTVYSADGGGGDQVLKTSTYDLVSLYDFSDGDNILLLAEGQYAFDESSTGLSDTITLEIRNAGVTKFSISNTAPRSVNKYGWRIEVTYTVTGTTTGQVTVFYWQNLVANGTEAIASSGLPKTIFSKSVTGMDYTQFNWRIVDVNDSELGATYNFLNHFQAEVRKNIS